MSGDLDQHPGPAEPVAAARTGSPFADPRDGFGRTPWVAAAAVTVGLLCLSARYGFHRDELYFRIAGRHLGFGYVDQPPLTPLVARVERVLFGDSTTAIRVWPALVAGAVVLMAALLCRELGGSRRAQAIVAVGVAASPGVLLAGHTLSTETTDVLAWQVIALLAVRALRTGRTRLWLAVGAAVGLGLQNKDLPGFLAAALLAGLLLYHRREVLTSRWLWLGLVLALAIAAPDVAWQAAHGFPQWQVAQAQRHGTGATKYLLQQLVVLNPALLPAVARGVRALWRDRLLRPLAWAFGLLEVFFLVTGGKAYYPAPILILLAAAGMAVAPARRSARRWAPLPGRRWAPRPGRSRIGLHYAAILGLGLLLLPAVLPVLPEATFAATAYAAEDDARATIGWPQLAHQVDAALVRDRRGPGPGAVITQSYGEAGALARFGHSNVPVFSGHNSLWYYGRPADGVEVVLTVGYGPATLATWFASCSVVATVGTPYQLDNQENGAPIAICTHPRAPWSRLWPALRHDN